MENRCLGNHKSSQKWAARQAGDCPPRFPLRLPTGIFPYALLRPHTGAGGRVDASGMGLPKQTHVLPPSLTLPGSPLRSDFPKPPCGGQVDAPRSQRALAMT